VKLSTELRGILIKKLSNALMEKVSLADFNEVFLFLDQYDKSYKIVPYGIYENPDNLDTLLTTEAGMVFSGWLDRVASKIEKDFNKGRKLRRLFKTIVQDYHDKIAFNMAAGDIFTISITSLFTGNDLTSLPFYLDLVDQDNLEDKLPKLEYSLSLLRSYMAGLFFLDLVKHPDYVEKTLELFVMGESDTLLTDLVRLASDHNSTVGVDQS
jgi:hypothetical protein